MDNASPPPAAPTPGGAAQVGIVCESVACLDPSKVEAMGIRVIPVPFVIDGHTHFDGVDLSHEEFYRQLERSGRAPTTSAPAPAAYIDAFRAAGTPNVVCVTVSGSVSTMAERCRLAIQQAKEQLPDVQIALFDSGTAAMAQGLLALEAARLAQTGAALTDVLDRLKQRRAGAHLMIVLDTLKYLSQTGRLGSIAAMAGGMLSIKPVVHCSNDRFAPVEICRTRQKALDSMLNRLVKDVEATRTQHVVLQHAAAAQQAEELRAVTARRIPDVDLSIVPFSPVMGTYAGPGLLGYAWQQGQ